MATITKHIGKMKDAVTRVAVAFRSLPQEPDYALVVSTDNLPSDVLPETGPREDSAKLRAKVNRMNLNKAFVRFLESK